MPDEKPLHEKLERVLHHFDAVQSAYFDAHHRAHLLRRELRELELRIAEGQELIDMTVVRSWPPLPEPVRPPTLHEAIRTVLEIKENRWMRPRDIAVEIARRRLYRRRDGLAARVNDVSARISAYRGLFERSGPLVRLRVAPPGCPPTREIIRLEPGRSHVRRTA